MLLHFRIKKEAFGAIYINPFPDITMILIDCMGKNQLVRELLTEGWDGAPDAVVFGTV